MIMCISVAVVPETPIGWSPDVGADSADGAGDPVELGMSK
jgi:hypothetical protein